MTLVVIDGPIASLVRNAVLRTTGHPTTNQHAHGVTDRGRAGPRKLIQDKRYVAIFGGIWYGCSQMLDHLDPRIGHNFIDANVLDRTGGPEAAAVDEILEMHQREGHDFRLLLPYSVKKEIEHPHTPPEVKHRAAHMIYSTEVELTDPEMETHQKVRALVQGKAKSGQHDRDAFHLVESAKYGGRHFITNDGRLLKKANEIWGMLQLRVLTPTEWLTAYNAHARGQSL